jgi:hypothetical protein
VPVCRSLPNRSSHNIFMLYNIRQMLHGRISRGPVLGQVSLVGMRITSQDIPLDQSKERSEAA